MWRTRRATDGRNKKTATMNLELSIPIHFRCPISLELMKDPVTVSTGITYDRQSIETWISNGNLTCPVTNQPLLLPSDHQLIPNHVTRRTIQDWCVANRVDRIPTPKVPITPGAVTRILSEICAVAQRGDHVKWRELAREVKAMAKESDRNRRCLSSNGAGHALTKSFDAFAGLEGEHYNVEVLEDILSALPEAFPLDVDSCRRLSTPHCMKSMVGFLTRGNVTSQVNAVVVLREIVACGVENNGSTDVANVAARTEGLIEELVKLLQNPISSVTTKSILSITFHMMVDLESGKKFVETGIVHVLVDLLVDGDKSTSEKALGTLDRICDTQHGQEVVQSHALTVPLLVKKMFRVSDAATEFAVSALWKICRRGGEGSSLDEAFQAGAFHKLLLLLQVGCGRETKVKATQLMKLLNAHKGTMECFDPMDLKGLKRSF